MIMSIKDFINFLYDSRVKELNITNLDVSDIEYKFHVKCSLLVADSHNKTIKIPKLKTNLIKASTFGSRKLLPKSIKQRS
jgi:hypothetical protein